mmetsp:Transcript_32624/g.59271  ORF Transcript_32624/g.59271 Transcript_32624/m.59271 type:complete len:101 (-) Transcript_32624:40-342(-)
MAAAAATAAAAAIAPGVMGSPTVELPRPAAMKRALRTPEEAVAEFARGVDGLLPPAKRGLLPEPPIGLLSLPEDEVGLHDRDAAVVRLLFGSTVRPSAPS